MWDKVGGTAGGPHAGVFHNFERSGPGIWGDGFGAWLRGTWVGAQNDSFI